MTDGDIPTAVERTIILFWFLMLVALGIFSIFHAYL